MTHYINIREELYPLTRMGSGYSKRSNKCCSCTATESVERTGCKPDDGTEAQGPNKNQEAQRDLDDNCHFGKTYSERGVDLGGQPPEFCPNDCKHILSMGTPEIEGTPVFCELYEKVRYTE